MKRRKSKGKNKANPIAKSLKDARYRKRIVKSKVKYSRKRSNKGCDKMSQITHNLFY